MSEQFTKMFGPLYVQGYTAALQDVRNVLTGIQDDLKRHKRRQSAKTYIEIIDCMIANRVELRENPKAFIRCNDNVPGGYELWEER